MELVRHRFDRSIFRQARTCYVFSTDNGAPVGASLPIDHRLNPKFPPPVLHSSHDMRAATGARTQ